MIQVSYTGTSFTVLVDGVAHGRFYTRDAAIQAALDLREQQDPIKLGEC